MVMKKKSELMKALEELTENRLLSSEVEALFEPYQDAVFPLSLSFVSAERSFGSQKDEKYNGGYKVICDAEKWDVKLSLLFGPEDNDLVESFEPGQDFEANVRFIDYDSLYQRAIFGKLGSEADQSDQSEEHEVISPATDEEAVPTGEENELEMVQEKVVTAQEEPLISETKSPVTESDPEIPEPVTEDSKQSDDTSEEVWDWQPDDEEANTIGNDMEVSGSNSAQSDPDPEIPTPPVRKQIMIPGVADKVSDSEQSVPDPPEVPQGPKKNARYVYDEEESYLYEDEPDSVEVDENSHLYESESLGCLSGCFARSLYVVGTILFLGGCTMIVNEEGGGGPMFLGFLLMGIGYLVHKSTSKNQ